MSASTDVETVTLDIPVTLRVTMALPKAPPGGFQVAAEQLASEATKSLAHVSAARLKAFNEVHRVLHPALQGEILNVESLEQQAGPVTVRKAG